jgi:DNA modification methylase
MSSRSALDHASSSLAVVNRRIDQLQPDPRNPRVHKPRQVRAIADSIEEFGFNVPVLIDGQGRIIAGHGRVLAARKLGWTAVPTIQIEHLTEPQIRAYQIADNKLTENAGWHEQLLGEIFRDLSNLNLDFSIEITGFTMGEIDLFIEGLDAPAEADPDDKMPAPPGGPAVTRPGDLWQLGRHRVLCGNALDSQAWQTLMQGDRSDMMFTDPPYNVPIQGHVSGLGAIRHREFAMGVGEMTEAEFSGFLESFMRLAAGNSRDGALHFLCMDWRHIGTLLAAAGQVYAEHKNICVWEKDNAGMGSFYRSQHELISVHKNGRGPHRNNVELGRHGRYRTNVWRYPGISTLSRTSEEGNLLALHPTVKPAALVADAILDASARGDLVLDCFLGSGTTLMAAERVGRRGYGLELDPLYVDTIIRRWQAHSGDVARHASTGQSFAEISIGERDGAEMIDGN